MYQSWMTGRDFLRALFRVVVLSRVSFLVSRFLCYVTQLRRVSSQVHVIANLFAFLPFCYIVLAGENAFSLHVKFFLSLKPVALLKKDLRLMIFPGKWIKVEGLEQWSIYLINNHDPINVILLSNLLFCADFLPSLNSALCYPRYYASTWRSPLFVFRPKNFVCASLPGIQSFQVVQSSLHLNSCLTRSIAAK